MHYLPDSAVVGTAGRVRHFAHKRHARRTHVAEGAWGLYFRLIERMVTRLTGERG